MSRRFRAAILGGLALVGLAGVSRPASAHSELVSSEPAAGSTVTALPGTIVAVFSERPDPGRSSLVVVDASGAVRSRGAATAVPGRPVALSVPVVAGGDGVYAVQWRTVAADDGHVASGTFSFGVRAASAGAPSVVSPPAMSAEAPGAAMGISGHPAMQMPMPDARSTAIPAPVAVPPSRTDGESVALTSQAVRARWVYYLGLIGLVAIAFVSFAVFRPAPRLLLRWGLPGAWVLAVGGCAGLAGMGTSVGGLAPGGRAFPVIIAAVPIALVLTADELPSHWRVADLGLGGVGVCAALCMLADVRSSHAASAPSWAWLLVGVQWIHFLSVAVWIGGLIVIVAGLGLVDRSMRSAAVRRYSTAAAVALFAVAVSGTVQAAAEVRSWHGLVATEFGRLVMLKVSVIVVLAGLGALNRYRHVPRVDTNPSGLGRVAAVEGAIGVAALAVTAVLQNAAPASALQTVAQPAPPRPVIVRGADPIKTVRVALRRAPLVGGQDQFRVAVTDFSSGAPVDASRVVLRFTRANRPAAAGMSDLTLSATGSGTYSGEGDNAGASGRWKVTVIVERDAAGTEVPLSLLTPAT